MCVSFTEWNILAVVEMQEDTAPLETVMLEIVEHRYTQCTSEEK